MKCLELYKGLYTWLSEFPEDVEGSKGMVLQKL